MGAPQIIIIVLHALKVGVNLARQGQPIESKYDVVTSSISTGIVIAVLYWGGFLIRKGKSDGITECNH